MPEPVNLMSPIDYLKLRGEVTLAAIEDGLWAALKQNDPEGWERLGGRRWNENKQIRNMLDAYLGWFVCPRAHAQKYELYILDLKTSVDLARWSRSPFAERMRYFDGDDLVFALGDLQ